MFDALGAVVPGDGRSRLEPFPEVGLLPVEAVLPLEGAGSLPEGAIPLEGAGSLGDALVVLLDGVGPLPDEVVLPLEGVGSLPGGVVLPPDETGPLEGAGPLPEGVVPVPDGVVPVPLGGFCWAPGKLAVASDAEGLFGAEFGGVPVVPLALGVPGD